MYSIDYDKRILYNFRLSHPDLKGQSPSTNNRRFGDSPYNERKHHEER